MEKECFQHFSFSRRSFHGFDMPAQFTTHWSITSPNVVTLKHADYCIHEILGKNLSKAVSLDKDTFPLAPFSILVRKDTNQLSETVRLLK